MDQSCPDCKPNTPVFSIVGQAMPSQTHMCGADCDICTMSGTAMYVFAVLIVMGIATLVVLQAKVLKALHKKK